MPDDTNPAHYRQHPSGVECIAITEHMGFLLGNVVKYVWRADLKGDALTDLRKARWYLDREIARREAGKATPAEAAKASFSGCPHVQTGRGCQTHLECSRQGVCLQRGER